LARSSSPRSRSLAFGFFGAFTLDLSHHSYSAVIGGANAPSTIFYNGSFIERVGVWTATPPKVLYGDHIPEMHK
jgi:hypothetical protein